MTTRWTDVPRPMDPPRARVAADADMLGRLSAHHGPPRSLIVGGGVVAVAALTAASFAYLTPKDATETSLVSCHTTAELGQGSSFTGVSLSSPALNGAGPAVAIEDAVRGCADLWRDGWISAGSTAATKPGRGAPYEVPQLTGCVTADGVAAVFPAGATICSELGLAPLKQ